MTLDVEKIKRHQQNAVYMIERYINSQTETKSALIQMPTGTGKSGVMAFSVNLFSAKSFLIIVPNAALPYQMKEELTSRFWKNIGESERDKRQAIIVTNKTDFSDGGVFIITIQQLMEIKKRSTDRFEALKNCIDVLFYDEGHHEPANEWSKVSRDFPCKKVLFTATPYRNDYKILDISEKYKYTYKLKEAIEEGIIVEPVFHKIPDDIIVDPNEISAFIKENSCGHKALVRIMGANRIKEIGAAFPDETRVACCHSNLSSDRDRHYYRTGIKLLNEADRFDIILQTDMISEGIDIPALDQLYYIDGYNNSKSMVQIIGRVLRKYDSKEKADVFVPVSRFGCVKRQWEICTDDVEERIYVNGRFVAKTSIFDAEDIIRKINFEKQARVFEADHSVFDDLVESIRDHLDKVSTIIIDLKEEKDVIGGNNLFVICYEHQTPSRYLREGYYLNSAFDYISLLEIDRGDIIYYFYHSTQRLFFDSEKVKSISPDDLYKLISDDSQLLHVSFQSSMSSSVGIKNYDYKGIRLDSMASRREQRLGLFHNALASNENKIRYIGNNKSKVTDRKEFGDVKEYVEWCMELAEKIRSGSGYSYFDRFASVVKRPAGERIDFILIRDCYIELTTEPPRKAYLYDLFEVNDNRFTIKKDGIEVECTIAELNDKWIVTIDAGDGEEYKINLAEKEEDYLINRIKSSFMLYYCSSNTIYSEGFYYRPNIQLQYSDPSRFELRSRIEAVSGMEKCVNEKYGSHPGGDFGGIFPEDSIFGVVQQYLTRDPNEFDYIICEDMGNEIADLIAVNSTQHRICMIHCKHGITGIGASAFHEVCGQAIKNITEFVVTNSRQIPYLKSLIGRWKINEWKSSKDGKEYTSKRFLKGDSEAFESVFTSIIESATARKEVWIATSGLSLSKLDQELTKTSPDRALLPMIHLLHSTEDVFTGLGVNFRILCKP